MLFSANFVSPAVATPIECWCSSPTPTRSNHQHWHTPSSDTLQQHRPVLFPKELPRSTSNNFSSMKTFYSILAFALAGFSCCLAAQALEESKTIGRSQHKTRRQLQQFRPVSVFPYARCGNLSSKGAPYYLYGPDWSIAEDGIASYTFGIGYKGPRATPFPCYTTLEQSMYKLLINIYTSCGPAMRVAGLNAVVNGVLRPIHLYEYPQGTALSIPKLGLNASTADGSTITFRASAPCNQPGLLFKPNRAKNVSMEYAFSESSAHECCGRSV